jgi:hypothetical protein
MKPLPGQYSNPGSSPGVSWVTIPWTSSGIPQTALPLKAYVGSVKRALEVLTE